MRNRMFWTHETAIVVLLLGASIRINQIAGDEEPNVAAVPGQRIQSPMLEVFMSLPANTREVRSFKSYLGVQPDSKKYVDVRSYEVSHSNKRGKREATEKPNAEKPLAQQLVSPMKKDNPKQTDAGDPMLPVPDAIRGPAYTPYSVKEFDLVDVDDPTYPKRRRNDSADGRDDSQRDKRTFPEGGSDLGESTTPLPYWKRKKESPQFITGRGSTSKVNDYSPPQHRSADSARESHSLKNLDPKSVQTNEIGRSNQDNYFSSTNRRTYSRQSDNGAGSTPKSVYDTIDYSKKSQEGSRLNVLRTFDGDRKEMFMRDRRPNTHEQYMNQQQYVYQQYPRNDRPYYQPPPFPSEVIGRGVEYFHRTYEPATGRIVYYANMPENGRHLDYRYSDNVNRNLYSSRQYVPDNYYKSFVPPVDYRYPMGASARPMDYMRTGRSNSQAYSYPYGGEMANKYQRDARFTAGYSDRANRISDDVRNKTYIIYDADEARAQMMRNQYPGDRLSYNGPLPLPSLNNYQAPQEPFRRFPPPQPVDYFTQSGFPFRNQVYSYSPPPGSFWGFANRGAGGGVQTDGGRWPPMNGLVTANSNFRSLNSPEVQLPLSTATDNNTVRSGSDLDKKKA